MGRYLPPLEPCVGYTAGGLQKVEYVGGSRPEEGRALRLHLKGGTTIDVPSGRDEMRRLALTLCDAFSDDVVAHLMISRNLV
jgi:hypothetical protein